MEVFCDFSHYIIIWYKITRLQAFVRGKLARHPISLRLGYDTIIVQATARRFLSGKKIEAKIVSDVLVPSTAQELRESNGSKRIQFWLRIVMD
jgi:hypothetical protein